MFLLAFASTRLAYSAAITLSTSPRCLSVVVTPIKNDHVQEVRSPAVSAASNVNGIDNLYTKRLGCRWHSGGNSEHSHPEIMCSPWVLFSAHTYMLDVLSPPSLAPPLFSPIMSSLTGAQDMRQPRVNKAIMARYIGEAVRLMARFISVCPPLITLIILLTRC